MPEAQPIEKAVDWSALLGLFSYQQAEQDALAETLYKLKVDAYEEAIYEEAHRMGFEVDRSAVSLDNAQTRSHLRKQARRHAGFIVNTYNRDLHKKLDDMSQQQYPLKNRYQLAADLDRWSSGRFSKRVDMVATTESFTPLMRGTIDFYRQNGIDTDFIFDSEPASCALCKRLEATNPHPIRKVMRLGIPHIGCVHSWSPVVKSPDMPTHELWLGGTYRTREREVYREQ